MASDYAEGEELRALLHSVQVVQPRVLQDERPMTAEAQEAAYKKRIAVLEQRPFSGHQHPSVRTNPRKLAAETWQYVLAAFSRSNIETSHLSQSQFHRLLPDESSTDQGLAVWAQIITNNTPGITSQELAQVLRLRTTTAEHRDFEKGTTYYYIRSWTFTVEEIRSVIMHLMAEGISHHELVEWMKLSQVYQSRDPDGNPLFTVRYVGMVRGPRSPVTRWLEDVNERISGLMFDFLRVTEIYFPEINAACHIQTILNATFAWQQDPTTMDDTERFMIQLLGHKTLLNRAVGGVYVNYVPSDNDMVLFQNLKTNFFRRFKHLGHNPSDDVVDAVQSHFESVQETVQEYPREFGTFRRPFTDDVRDVCIRQGTPPLQVHGTTILLLVGRDITIKGYSLLETFLDGTGPSGRLTANFLKRLAQNEADFWSHPINPRTLKLQIPFVDLWPCLKHEELDQAIAWLSQYIGSVRPLIAVSFGKLVTSIARADLQHSHGLVKGADLTSNVGRLTIQHWDGNQDNDASAFINVAHYHPGYESHMNSTPLRRVLDLTWHMTILAADTAMSILEEHEDDVDPPSRRWLCEEVVNQIAISPDPGVSDLLPALEVARTDLSAFRLGQRRRSSRRLAEAPQLQFLESRDTFNLLGFAIGQPFSNERKLQLEGIWERDLPDLHQNIPREDARKDDWMHEFSRLREGHSYYLQVLSQTTNDEGDLDDDFYSAIIAQCPVTRGLVPKLNDAAVREKATFQASQHIRSLIDSHDSNRRRVWQEKVYTPSSEMDGLTVTVRGKTGPNATALFIRWKRSSGVRQFVQLHPPIKCLPVDENDMRKLAFTPEGIDICDGTGNALRSTTAAHFLYEPRATFEKQSLTAREGLDGGSAYELWLEVMAMKGYIPDEEPSPATTRTWSKVKGIGSISQKAKTENPKQNRPLHETDANWLLQAYVDERFPNGGWFRTAPIHRKADSTADVQGFVDFIKRPEYALHPYASQWLGHLDTANPNVQVLAPNLTFLRPTRQVATAQTTNIDPVTKKQTIVSETMFWLAPVGGQVAYLHVPGQRLQACLPCNKRCRKCELDMQNPDAPCKGCVDDGMECKRPAVKGVKEGKTANKAKGKKKKKATDEDVDTDGDADDGALAATTTKKKPKKSSITPRSKRSARQGEAESEGEAQPPAKRKRSKVDPEDLPKKKKRKADVFSGNDDEEDNDEEDNGDEDNDEDDSDEDDDYYEPKPAKADGRAGRRIKDRKEAPGKRMRTHRIYQPPTSTAGILPSSSNTTLHPPAGDAAPEESPERPPTRGKRR